MMIATTARISELILKFLNEGLSAEERGELDEWLHARPENRQLFEELVSPGHLREGIRSVYAAREAKQRIYKRVLEALSGARETEEAPVYRMRPRNLYRWAAAAAVLLIVSVSSWLLFSRHSDLSAVSIPALQFRNDIPPGGDRAVLTLANGSRIVLDKAHEGILATQGNSKVVKAGSGMLVYDPALSPHYSPLAIPYNILTTPRGGQYQVRLPDGTEVWLNAASSIRYPAAFTGKERRVEITGEAYFEVRRNASRPFIVTVNNMQVKVLGTHFNINAYTDEGSVKATLLEGRIKVQAAGNAVMLTPGQQVQLNKEGKIKLVKEADVDEAVAWKNGLFLFHGDELTAVMRQLSRWYDVQVVYKNNIAPVSHFSGAIRRQENISKVFKMLELTGGVHFEINGRKIIVSE